jgi:membrane protease YdiL (CAAX protease family)
LIAKQILAKAQLFASKSIKEIGSDRKKYAIATLITLAPVISLITIYSNPLLGVYINAITLAILATVAIKYEKYRKLSISIAIVPIVHLFNLSAPQDDLLLRTVIFYSLLLLLTLTYRYLFTLEAPKKPTSLSAIIALQALLIIMIIIGQWQSEALQTYFPFGIDSTSLTVFIFILFAIIEEAYFRGLVQANAISEVGKKSSVIIATLLFGFSFLGPDMPLALIFGIISGLLLSLLYVIRRSLILNIAANMLSKLLLIGLLAIFS